MAYGSGPGQSVFGLYRRTGLINGGVWNIRGREGLDGVDGI